MATSPATASEIALSLPSSTCGRPRHRNPGTRPTPYLIITNISKRQNVKNLLQIAAAYGCTTVFVVGQRAFEFDPDAEGTDVPSGIRNGVRNGKMQIVKFDKLDHCIKHIKSMPCCYIESVATEKTNVDTENVRVNNNDQPLNRPTIPIIGVEIDNSSKNIEAEPFNSSVAFMMGNEGSGMSEKQMAACDGFVRISQHGGGTASLNVSVAAGLVLHRFFHWSRGDAVQHYSHG